jgi:membrane protein implicated in regulation of membrane protease activity
MEAIGTAIGVAAVVYLLYEWITWVYALKHPPPAYKDEDPVLGRVAVVCRKFTGTDSSSFRAGAVELNGTTWEAETTDLEGSLDVGDSCRICGRDGLLLLVEPKS